MAGITGKANIRQLLRSVGQVQGIQSRELLKPDAQGGNRGLVITICMVTAFGLWLLLSLNDPGEIRLELRTAVANMPDDIAFAETPARSVMASVQGDVLTLFKLKFRPPLYTIDASQDITDSNMAVNWPQGITADFDSPQITLEREPRSRRTVPIVSRVDIQPASGYALFGDAALTPDSVTVTGASSIVDRVHSWSTASVRRAGIKDSLNFEVPLVDSLTGLLTLTHSRTVLSAKAHRFTEGIRELRVIVTDIPNSENVVDLDPSRVAVIFHAPLDQFDAVRESEDFIALVSYEAIRLDTTGSVIPQIRLPVDLLVRHVGTQPASLNYYVNTGLQ